MKHKYYIALIFGLLGHWLWGQQQGNVHVVGDELTVPAGNDLHILGSFEDLTGTTLFNGQPVMGSLSNGDTVYIGRNIINNSQNGLNVSDEGTIILNGDTIQILGGTRPAAYHNLFVDGDTITLYQVIEVTDSLQMITGKINNDSVIGGVNFGNQGRLYDESAANHIYGDLGQLILENRALTGTFNDIGGLGLSLEVDGSLGSSKVIRQNGQHAGAADGSIYRFYQIEPGTNGTLTSTKIEYFPHEVQEVAEDSITFWQSNNAGVIWNKQQTDRFPALDEVIGKSLTLSGTTLITVADSLCAKSPIVNLGDDLAICEGTPVTLDAQNPGLFYLWNTGATTQTINVTNPGEYSVLVTDANGCVGADTIQMSSKSYPDVDFNLNFECQNEVSSFTSLSTIDEGGMTFRWDFGDTVIESDTSLLENPDFTYENSGAYDVKLVVTSDFNCADSVTKTYVVHPLPVPAFTADAVCDQQELSFVDASTITANIGALSYNISEYSWDFGVEDATEDVSSDTDPSFTYPGDGTYTTRLILESNAGCKDTLTWEVTVHPLPEAGFTASNVCFGTDLAIDNSSTISSGSLVYQWDFGDETASTETNPEKNYATYGDFEVVLTATSEEGCLDRDTVQVRAFDIPVPSFSVENACAEASISLVNETTINTEAALSFLWTFGDGTSSDEQNPEKSYAEPGEYTIALQVLSEEGCMASIEQSVTIYPNPVAGFVFDSECEGEGIRFVNNSVISSGFLTYSWDFGEGTSRTSKSPTQVFTEDGTYNVQMITSSTRGCQDTATASVEVFPLPIIDIQGEISTCAETLTLDAGNTGSQFLWSDNSTDQVFTVEEDGSYTVTVTTVNGCSATQSSEVSLQSVFTPNLPATVTGCGEVILDGGNAGALSYNWSTGDTTRQITVTRSGSYSVDIVDQNGCSGSQTIEVTVEPVPLVNLGDDLEVCEGEELILDVASPEATYAWSDGSTRSLLEVSESGTYWVTVTNTAGCQQSDTIQVIVKPTPVVDLGPDRNSCGTVVLSGPEGFDSYVWDDGDTSPSRVFDASGTYQLTVSSSAGCTASDEVEILIDPVPEINLADTYEACSGELIDLDAANEGLSINWSTGETSSTITVGSSGLYTVTVENSLGCTTTDWTEVIIYPKVQVDLGEDQTICTGNTVELSPLALSGDYTFSWTGIEQGELGSGESLTVDRQDEYMLTATSPQGCVGRDTVQLFVATDTVFADFLMASNAEIFDTLQFISLSVPAGLDHFWRFGDGNQSTKEDPQHVYLREGDYTIKLVVQNEFCESERIKTLNVQDPAAGGRTEGAPGNQLEEGEVRLPEVFEVSNAYPNPTAGVFTLDLLMSQAGTVELLITDYSGRLIMQRTYENLSELEQTFDITAHASGIYILRLQSQDETKILRILKHN
jgi:PKD repeat protein